VLFRSGFGCVSGNRLRSFCRLMQRYAREQAPAVAELTRLMGTTSGFDAHVRSLLDLRLAQVSEERVDNDLCEYVGRAVRDLAPDPECALVWVRRIANRALKLSWDAELPDGRLPAAWRAEWDSQDVRYAHDEGRLPRSFGAQCNILRIATGTERTSRRAKHISKTTYLLLDHLQSVGNFGQHTEDFPESRITIGFAASVVFGAISLVECLTYDLVGAVTA